MDCPSACFFFFFTWPAEEASLAVLHVFIENKSYIATNYKHVFRYLQQPGPEASRKLKHVRTAKKPAELAAPWHLSPRYH